MTPDQRARERSRYQRRRLAVLEQKRSYYADRKEERIAYQIEWNKNNRDKTKISNRRWVLRHPEEARTLVRNRAARRRDSGGSHTAAEIRELAKRQGHRCANPVCRRSIRKSHQVDHIIAISCGGRNDIKNIQLLCPTCNRKKSAKDPILWARENGLLL